MEQRAAGRAKSAVLAAEDEHFEQQQYEDDDYVREREHGAVESATSPVTAGAHLLMFLASCLMLRSLLLRGGFEGDPVGPALFLLAMCGATNMLVDIVIFKVHRRASTGLNYARYSPNLLRTLIKILGLAGSFGFILICYWLFPEYAGSFYNNYWRLLRLVLPVCAPFAAVYVYLVDACMVQPCDGYHNLGLALIFRWEWVDLGLLKQHLLGWLVKGFFVPLMFAPYTKDIPTILKADASVSFSTWNQIFEWTFSFLYFIDLHFATMGYLNTFRVADTHIRAAEGTVVGWVAALLCYPPINSVDAYYIHYQDSVMWGAWLRDWPALKFIWGSTILLLVAGYTTSTVLFGGRFSNLTNRGIITTGTYALTKHPAYLFKNISWWLVYVPWAATGSLSTRLKHCIRLLLFNGIYFLRAKCEEAMLAPDPAYARYSKYMERHGIFASFAQAIAGSPSQGGLAPPAHPTREVLLRKGDGVTVFTA